MLSLFIICYHISQYLLLASLHSPLQNTPRDFAKMQGAHPAATTAKRLCSQPVAITAWLITGYTLQRQPLCFYLRCLITIWLHSFPQLQSLPNSGAVTLTIIWVEKCRLHATPVPGQALNTNVHLFLFFNEVMYCWFITNISPSVGQKYCCLKGSSPNGEVCRGRMKGRYGGLAAVCSKLDFSIIKIYYLGRTDNVVS